MITIVSHDSGGAEIISEIYKRKKNHLFCLRGPAVSIFKKKNKKLKLSSLKKSIKKSNLVITGTSWPSKFEVNAIKYARENNIKVVTYLDHWIHYKMRFYIKNKIFLPNEIWVGDKIAYKIAQKNFPGKIIKIKKNYYFNNKINTIIKLQRKISPKNLLYICSPLVKNKFYKNNKLLFKYKENDLLNYFLKNINKLKIEFKKIIIRPHPSENIKKYIWTKKIFKNVVISNKNSLEKDICSAKFIFGYNSNPLVIGIRCKKKVCNVSPAGKKVNILPFKKILNFNELIKSV